MVFLRDNDDSSIGLLLGWRWSAKVVGGVAYVMKVHQVQKNACEVASLVVSSALVVDDTSVNSGVLLVASTIANDDRQVKKWEWRELDLQEEN